MIKESKIGEAFKTIKEALKDEDVLEFCDANEAKLSQMWEAHSERDDALPYSWFCLDVYIDREDYEGLKDPKEERENTVDWDALYELERDRRDGV